MPDYWRRWHISLTTWFTDYLYMPTVVKRRGWGFPLAAVWALMVTFTLSGLWHGAYWTFILFGVVHGIALCLDLVTRKQRNRLTAQIPARLYDGFCLIATFSFLCCVDVLFRADTLSDAVYVVPHMIVGTLRDVGDVVAAGFSVSAMNRLIQGLVLNKWEIGIAILLIVFLEGVQLAQSRLVIRDWLRTRPTWQRFAIYWAMSFAFLLLGSFNQSIQFIYFQF